MLYFDRIGVSKGVNINKASESKVGDICRYWYFLNKVFKFQPHVFDRCYDVLMMYKNLSNIAVLNINDYQ